MRRGSEAEELREILLITGQLYRGVLDADEFRSGLTRLAARLEATVCALHTYDFSRRRATGAALIDMSQETLDVYDAHFCTVNPWMHQGERSVRQGAVILSHELLDDASLLKTEFYSDFLKPRDLWASIGAVLDRRGEVSRTVTFLRPRSAGHFPEADRRLLATLMPHLRDAFRLRERLGNSGGFGASAGDPLEMLPMAALLLDRACRVLSHNRAAGRLDALRDGFALGRDGLDVADGGAAATVRLAVAGIASGRFRIEPGGPAITLIQRPSGKQPYLARVAPVLPQWAGDRDAEGLALLLVVDPEPTSGIVEKEASRLFGLTPSEGRFACALAEGMTVSEAAESFAISPNTARTHLKRIFLKTRTSRQSELVNLMASLRLLAEVGICPVTHLGDDRGPAHPQSYWLNRFRRSAPGRPDIPGWGRRARGRLHRLPWEEPMLLGRRTALPYLILAVCLFLLSLAVSARGKGDGIPSERPAERPASQASPAEVPRYSLTGRARQLADTSFPSLIGQFIPPALEGYSKQAESFMFLGPPDQPYALHFDGNQVAQAPLTPLLDLSQTFTMEAWVYLEGTGGATFTIMGKRHDWNDDPYVAFVLDVWGGYIRYQVGTGQPGSVREVYRQSGPLPGWLHLAVTQDAAKARLFVNGIEAGYPLENPPLPEVSPEAFAVGGALRPDGTFIGGGGWVGLLRQVRVWSKVLTPDEIRANASRYLTGLEPGLLAYWPLDDGPGQAARDLGPNHLPLTLGTTPGTDPTDPQWVGSASPCHLSCTATAPATADAGTPVTFTASPIWTGCSGTPSYQWAFGDGQTSAERSPEHSFSLPGSYAWTVTVIADDRWCESGGTITIITPCTGLCAASVQDQGTVGVPVSFASNGLFCSGVPSFAWTFGDGQTSSMRNPSHTYMTDGIFHWTLTVADGGANCGQSGTVTIDANLTPPKQDWALKFSGGNAAVSDDSPAFDLGSSFTLETWIFPEEEVVGGFIMGRTHDPLHDPPSSYALVFGNPWRVGLVQSTGQPGSQVWAMGPNPIPLRTWTHLAGVLGGGILRLYINGEQVAEAPSPGPIETSHMPFSLGNQLWVDGGVYGGTIESALRQARIWNRALTAAELKANATRYLTGGEPGLVAGWPLDEGLGTTRVRDLSPNHLDLHLEGARWPAWNHVYTLNTGPYFSFEASPTERIGQVAFIDFDHDGYPDLLAVEVADLPSPSKLKALKNDGHGHFSDVSDSVFDHVIEVIAPTFLVEDFDGDGIRDVFVSDYGIDGNPEPWQSQFLLGTSNGRLIDATAQCLPLVPAKTYTSVAGDFRKLGRLDVLMANESRTVTAPPPTFYLNDGHAHFTSDPSILPVSLRDLTTCAFVDVNKDGFLGMYGFGYSASGESQEYLFINNGHGGFSVAPTWALPPLQSVDYGRPEYPISVDFDGDGWPDLLMIDIWNSYNLTHQLRLLLNNRDGTFRDASDRIPQDPLNVSYGTQVPPSIADLNGDGLPDFLLTTRLSASGGQESFLPKLYLSTGSANFIDESELVRFDAVEVMCADVTSDGLADLLMMSVGSSIGVAKQVKPFMPPVEWTRNFTIDPSPAHRFVQPGESTSFDAVFHSMNGFSEPVCLSTYVKPTDPGIHTNLASDLVNPDGSAGVSISTGVDTPPGIYWVTVLATSDDISHRTSIPLLICGVTCTASPSVSSGNAPVAVDFTGNATASGPCAAPPTYDWDFGDSAPHSSEQSPGHTYDSVGTFTWTLIVSAGEALCSKTGAITVVPPCSLTCAATVPSSGQAGTAVAFSSTSTPSNCSGTPAYDWDFGDGTAHGSTQYPSHAYSSAGNFNWVLTVSVNGVTCTKTGSTAVIPPCTLTCAATVPSTGQAGTAVAFSSTATPSNCSGTPTFDWDFGDGSAHGVAQNESHTYASAGSFNWVLTVSVNGVTCTKTGSIAVIPPCALTCTASGPSSGQVGTATVFSSTATPSNCSGTPTFDWDFGDGTAHGSTQDPSHTYSSTGSFNWELTVSVNGVTCTKTGSIAVIPPCALTCMASGPSSGQVGTATVFSSTSTLSNCSGTPTFDWDFGDGTEHDSGQNPSHTYASAGSFNWVFTVSVNGLTCTKTGTITVSPPCTLACAASVPPSGQVGTAVAFSSTATPSDCGGTPVCDWDFGDGSTHGTAQNVSHTYTSAGSFNWVLTLSVNGVTCTKTGTLTVVPPCSLACTASVPSAAVAGTPVSYASTATPSNCSGTPSFDWNFGDSSAHGATQNPTHTYASAGSYTWTLTVSNDGVTCTKSGTITITPPVAPPVIASLAKMAPFAIKVTGSNLQQGIKVFINNSEWTTVTWKKTTKLTLGGGKALKTAVPRGVPTQFRFVNLDGGEATTVWNW